MHRIAAHPALLCSRARLTPHIRDDILPLLLFLTLALVPFWDPLVHPRRIAVSADIISSVSAPWDVAPLRARPRNGLQGDAVMLILPMRHFARDELLAGRFPFWNPYVLGGSPFFANDQAAVLSPLNLLTLPLPLTTGWAMLAALKLFLAGLGTYCYCRAMGLRRLAGVFAGVAFMGSAPILNWVHWPLASVAICLPWLFWAIEQLIRAAPRHRAAWVALLAGVVATQFYAGHIETSVHILLAASAYLAFRSIQAGQSIRGALRLLSLCAAGLTLGAALAAFQLLPAAQTLQQSAIARDRAQQDIFQLPLEYLAAWVIPNFWGGSIFPLPNIEWGIRNAYETTGYVGVPCLVLALLAAVVKRGHRATMIFFGAMILVAGALVYDVPLLGRLAHLPILRDALNIRLVSVIGFGLAVLAALGLDGLLDRYEQRTQPAHRWPGRTLLCLAGGLVIAAYAVTPRAVARLFVMLAPYRDLPDHGTWDRVWAAVAALWLVISLAALIALMRGAIGVRIAGVMLLLALTADLALYGAHINPTDDARLLFPETPAIARIRQTTGDGRIAGYLDTLRPNAAAWLGLRDLRGYEPTASQRANDYLISAALPDALNGQPNRPVNPAYLAMAGVNTYLGPPLAAVYTQQGNEMDGHLVAGERDETEWVVAPTDGLAAIELFITPRSITAVPLEMTLHDTRGNVVAAATIASCTASAGCPIRFSFPPILRSGGQGYGVTLAAPAAPPDRGVSPWFTREPDQQVAAGRLIAGQHADGGLYFRLFIAPGAGMPTTWATENIQAWAVPNARPRAYFASRIVTVCDEASALSVIPEIAATPGAVVVEGNSGAMPVSEGAVEVMRDTPGNIALQTTHPGGPGLLVLNESGDLGWHATIDGHAAPIRHANGIAQAIAVPAGVHVVRFIYQPRAALVGGAISGVAGFVSVILLVWPWLRRRRSRRFDADSDTAY